MKPVALGRQSVGAWMLYEDTEGHAQVQCIPVAFSELAVQPGAGQAGCRLP